MAEVIGVEPMSSALEADVLATELNFYWYSYTDSNRSLMAENHLS